MSEGGSLRRRGRIGLVQQLHRAAQILWSADFHGNPLITHGWTRPAKAVNKLSGGGCYAIQLDGERLRRVKTFGARQRGKDLALAEVGNHAEHLPFGYARPVGHFSPKQSRPLFHGFRDVGEFATFSHGIYFTLRCVLSFILAWQVGWLQVSSGTARGQPS